MNVCTCGGGAQHHRHGAGDAEVPDPVPVAHVLLEQLAHSPGPRGGFEAGHNLSRGGEKRGGHDGENNGRTMCFSPGVELK